VTNFPLATIAGSVVDVIGRDAATILHNLTTANVKKLEIGQCVESFITEVKGRTVGHVIVKRMSDRFRLIGASGQSAAIAAQVDRYTIREDATAQIRDDEFCIEVYPPHSNSNAIDSIAANWLGEETSICLQEKTPSQDVNLEAFHDARILAGFPWHGIDFDESNLPQEVDRDDVAISFNKGCYLGQETIARLDAMGQVQKKLVRLNIQSDPVSAGEVISLDSKPVARITSVTRDGRVALAMVRRAWFDKSTICIGTTSGGQEFRAVVN
jgi:tRNA-modifying protein YgfZ